MTRIDIVLYEGFDELDAVGPYEVFSNAAKRGADLEPRLVTVDGRDRVTASHGLRVEADGTLPGPDAPDRPDVVVVPGGGWSDRSEAGAWTEAEKGEVPEAVAAHHAVGATVASVCTGGMLLATAGLTDDRPAVTHASALSDLRASGAEVVDARVVDDGDLLSAGGVTSGIDLALHLVEREAGARIAEDVATALEYERRGVVAS
ncbi:DJ-1/PfpI family protein [Halegenticoccus tardaugens]|uniref:DJ-1/PfpI family protein n=1 Tax=Halegenticoccus tardaugens TaxID=2071624 RepID=UPI00100A7EF4|nr:DJ-1/PfpI family protein [Halegenticoccus tardaugens]